MLDVVALDFSTYDFPCPELEALSNEALRNKLFGSLNMANEQPDGLDCFVLPEAIDYAQSVVAQCRDLLALRGEAFTPEERRDMAFLSWS